MKKYEKPTLKLVPMKTDVIVTSCIQCVDCNKDCWQDEWEWCDYGICNPDH